MGEKSGSYTHFIRAEKLIFNFSSIILNNINLGFAPILIYGNSIFNYFIPWVDIN